MGYDKPLNVAIISDLPGNSGLGSSSSFTVGFVALMEYLSGRSITKYDLFKRAVHTERDLLKENVGIQDQIHAAFGGLNLYQFHKDDLTIRPAQMATECRNALDRSLCLIYTGIQRHASTAVQEQLRNTEAEKNHQDLSRLVKLCREGLALLEGRDPETMLRDLGKLVSEGWETKRRPRPMLRCRRLTRLTTKRCVSALMAANSAARAAAVSCSSWRLITFRQR
jgi:D-glycero-alpha-D-manno-heptose-7-phosphate kinase